MIITRGMRGIHFIIRLGNEEVESSRMSVMDADYIDRTYREGRKKIKQA